MERLRSYGGMNSGWSPWGRRLEFAGPRRGEMNALILFATSLLFQSSATMPLIDNARVSVWEGRAPKGPLAFDTLTVSPTGSVKYFLKGSPSVDGKVGHRIQTWQRGSACE